MTLGRRLIGLIEAKGVTAKWVADAAGINPSIITRCCVEDQEVNVRRRTLEALSNALDVSTDYLVGRRPDLDKMEFKTVAAQESFQVFQRSQKLKVTERNRYELLATNQDAPRTFEGWRRFDLLRREYFKNRHRNPEEGIIRASQRFGHRASR